MESTAQIHLPKDYDFSSYFPYSNSSHDKEEKLAIFGDDLVVVLFRIRFGCVWQKFPRNDGLNKQEVRVCLM